MGIPGMIDIRLEAEGGVLPPTYIVLTGDFPAKEEDLLRSGVVDEVASPF